MLARLRRKSRLLVRLVEQSGGARWARIRFRRDAETKLVTPGLDERLSLPRGATRFGRLHRIGLPATLRHPFARPCRRPAGRRRTLFRRAFPPPAPRPG